MATNMDMELTTRKEFLTKNHIDVFYINRNHNCTEHCTLVNPFGCGPHYICTASLKYHNCHLDNGRQCILVYSEDRLVCRLTGQSKDNGDMVGIYAGREKPLYTMPSTSYHRRTTVRYKDQEMQRLHSTLACVIAKLYNSKNRLHYNTIDRVKTLSVESIFREMKNDILRDRMSLAASWQHQFNKHVHILNQIHFPYSSLSAFEEYMHKVLQTILSHMPQNHVRRRSLTTLLANPESTILYVMRCVLEGFGHGGINVLNTKFEHMGPLPLDRHLHSHFDVNPKKLTQCSKILQDVMTSKTCLRILVKI